MSEKRFKLQDKNGHDVMGGELSLENPYVSSYGVLKKGKLPSEMEVDDVSVMEYSLSGQKATEYYLVRVK